ncbi:MAG TPA: hypothetical protein VLH61_05440 [Bacteroidales bacterium]|nr:hypothetical protein [Bacteroidales bacterium]
MNREKFVELLENPESLKSKTANQLRKLAISYPYCQPLRLLLVKNLQRINSVDFEEQVNQAAALAVDRRRFQNFMSGRPKVSSETITRKETRSSEKNGGWPYLIFQFLSRKKASKLFTPSSDNNFSGFETIKDLGKPAIIEKELFSQVNVPEIETRPPRRKYDLLIEKFINEDPRIGLPKKDMPIENLAEKPFSGVDEFATETLAQIFVRQGLYSRAIDIYQKLSVKYPEKSSYFAEKISTLKSPTN